MTGFKEIQEALDRILKGSGTPTHGPFWRGKTRNEFIDLQPFGLPIVELGKPNESNLVLALRGESPFGSDLSPKPSGAVFRRMPAGLPPATNEDLLLIESWIEAGCPEKGQALPPKPTDQVHVQYWREVDIFFLPGLSSPETQTHVNRVHFNAFQRWSQSPDVFAAYMAEPKNRESLDYIRFHQHRLIASHYGDSIDSLFDSLWKFGGNLLPIDPLSQARPQHTMNSVDDWFFWAPSLDATLRSSNVTESDMNLARAWQVGIVADGLIRTDSGRPVNLRIPIHDFDPGSPDLKRTVMDTFRSADTGELLAKMGSRYADYQQP